MNGQKTNGMAITGLVMGILTLTLGLCCGGPIFAVLGIIFSAVGISQINRNPTLYAGKGMAVTGLVLSIVGLATMPIRYLGCVCK